MAKKVRRGDRQPTFEALSVVVQAAPRGDAAVLARQLARRVGLRKKGYSPKYGFGRVNADAAVAAALRRTRRRSRSAGKKR